MYFFSKRTAWDRKPNAFFARHVELTQRQTDMADLTVSNPTAAGFTHPDQQLRAVFSATGTYDPRPLGLDAAREAVATYYRHHGRDIAREAVWIGAGTSELYAHALSILCNPGDAWLVPQPGYPLFDYLADLAGVRLIRYPLSYECGTWHLDMDALAHALASEPRARALVLISPHNPTGHCVSDPEWEQLVALIANRPVALVVDEVFLDYPIAEEHIATRAGNETCLTICCSGISKVAAYPQGKLAWAAVSGPAATVREFLERAEVVTDAFLNTSTVIQAGLEALLGAAPPMQAAIRARCLTNWSSARDVCAEAPVSVLDPGGGWMLLLELPATRDDANWAWQALESCHVLTHPGYLYGLDSACSRPILAVSLLTPPDIFQAGLRRIQALIDEQVAHGLPMRT